MKKVAARFAFLTAFLVMTVIGLSVSAEAQGRNQRDVRDIVRNLNSKIGEFEYSLNFRLKSMSSPQNVVDRASRSVNTLKTEMSSFSEVFERRQENHNHVNEIISAASTIDAFMIQNPQDRRVAAMWGDITSLIDRLAVNYGVSANWRSANSRQPVISGSRTMPAAINSPLTGTYRLQSSRSENVSEIIASTGVSGNDRRDLENKLELPSEIALKTIGNRVTIATTNSQPMSFDADGSEKTEQNGNDDIRVKASLDGNKLTLASLGQNSDNTIIFESADGGRTLKVTRRITTPYLNETIFADSFYTKTDEVAGLGIVNDDSDDNTAYSSSNDPYPVNDDDDDIGYSDNSTNSGNSGGYSSNDPYDNQTGQNTQNPTMSRPRIGEFIIPDGEIISGTLQNEINTKDSQDNDRFKMIVTAPTRYNGAVIEGHITGVNRSGRVSGRPNLTFNFERITMPDGREYDFAGYLQSVRDQNGKDVRIDSEGSASGGNRTNETVKRSGIGAGIGAVIGAIAGGGKGAAIGAIIGGGAGAGSVIAGGRDDIRLTQGSTITVRSSSPIRGSGN